jgi:hypothetical protein
MQIDLRPGTLKYRTGNYVVYDIDYLLSHKDQEIRLLADYTERRKTAKPLKWEAVLREVKELCEKGV